MKWNITTGIILLVVLFVGYGIGLLEMHLKRKKKIIVLDASGLPTILACRISLIWETMLLFSTIETGFSNTGEGSRGEITGEGGGGTTTGAGELTGELSSQGRIRERTATRRCRCWDVIPSGEFIEVPSRSNITF